MNSYAYSQLERGQSLFSRRVSSPTVSFRMFCLDYNIRTKIWHQVHMGVHASRPGRGHFSCL